MLYHWDHHRFVCPICHFNEEVNRELAKNRSQESSQETSDEAPDDGTPCSAPFSRLSVRSKQAKKPTRGIPYPFRRRTVFQRLR